MAAKKRNSTGGADDASALALELTPPEDQANLLFNAEGHHVIAEIMRLDLQANAPNILTKVDKILSDGDRGLFEAATFPDDIRGQQPQTKPFHFIDIPFTD